MNETITKDEFEEVYNMIKKEVDNLNFTVDFRLKHLLSLNLWGRVLVHPLASSRYFYHYIKKWF